MKKNHFKVILKVAVFILGAVVLMFPAVSYAGPGVTITSPQDKASVSGVVTVSADISGDAQEVSASLRNEVSGKTVFADKTGAGRYSIAIDTLANRDADNFESGIYYLSVQARDGGGSLGYDQITVNLSNGRYVPSVKTQSAPAPAPVVQSVPAPAPEPEPTPVVAEEAVPATP